MVFIGGWGCSIVRDGPPPTEPTSEPIDAIPRVEPLSKYGNPESYVVFNKRYKTLKSSAGYVKQGIASWYGTKFHGRRTSNGEIFNMHAMTAAHRTLPLPTYAKVTLLKTGRSVVVRINDRGPFHKDRVIDLSYAAAKKLGMVNSGLGRVEIRAIDPKEKTTNQARSTKDQAVTKTAQSKEVRTGKDAKHDKAFAESETYYLQLGAFVDHVRAKALSASVPFPLPEFVSVSINSAMYKGLRLYQVQLGPLPNRREADRLVEYALASGMAKPYVIKGP